METMRKAMGQAVTEAFQQLLSEKHLYQYVEVKLDKLKSASKFVLKEWASSDMAIRSLGEPTAEMRVSQEQEKILSQSWHPVGVESDFLVKSVFAGSFSQETLSFDMPTINTFCDVCDSKPPFNPAPSGSHFVQGEVLGDFYYLGYQCQQCKGEPIRFLVRRESLKLRLAGRYPIEIVPTPKFFPKDVSKFYSDALIAHHAGQTLAGLFLLRVFIEQFWRTIPEVQTFIGKQPRATGDEQGDLYQNSLRAEIRSGFPSLKDIYGRLSVAIHTADADSILFDESCSKLIDHFDARRLYKVK